MKKVINCNKEHNPCIDKVVKKVTLEEGELIAAELFQVLNYRKDAIGLSAPQLGIDAAVSVVNVKTPLYFINPRIVKQWDEITYKEGCLSYPNQTAYTKRYKYCIVEDDAYEGQYYFGPMYSPNHETGNDEGDDLGLLESICVQHEIMHLNGKTIFSNKLAPLKAEIRYSRNEKITITNGINEQELKYKKAIPLISSGEWHIKE